MRPRRSEDGASLVIVIVLIAVFGLMLAAVGTQGEAGVMANAGVRKERVDQYAASGAMDGAINSLRGNITRGREGLACPSFSTSSPNGTVDVVCTPQAGSGAAQPSANAPGYAVLTTAGLAGYPMQAGLEVSGGDNAFKVGGPIAVDSAIDVQSLDAGANAVTARDGCSGTIVGNPVTCNTGQTRADPGGGFNVEPTAPNPWASPVTTVPPGAPAPTCNATNKVATMAPGSYFDLGAMTTAFGACTVIWMQPGNYYFDWAVANAANTQWSITRTVVGGTALGWDPTGTSVPTVNVPGACDQTRAGVHLVFATTSRLDVGGKAAVELCASPSATTQQIAVYGRKTTQTVGLQSPPSFKPTTGGSSTPAALTNPFANVSSIDAVSNTASITGSGAVGTAILTGYGLASIPAGSTLNSVRVNIAHSESSATTDRITVTAGTQTLCSGLAVATHVGLSTDTIACPTNQLWLTPADAAATFTATRPASSGTTSVELDGVELLITYTPPALRAETANTVLVNMTAGGGNKRKVYVQGTLYAPYAMVVLDFKDNNEAVFNRGAVIDAFVGSNVPPAQLFSIFAAPPPTAFTDRVVAFVASMAGQRKLRAVVRFDDGNGTNPGQAVLVNRWTAVN